MAFAQLDPAFNSMSGRLGDFVFRHTARGTVVANPPVRSEAPATADQKVARRFFGASSRAWTQLSDFMRESWHRLAPEVGASTGQTLFNQASFYRQAAGLELPELAPMAVPGVGLLKLGIAAPEGSDSLRLVLEHGVSDVAGWRVLVQATRALPSPARQPQPYDFRAVCWLNPASVPELVACGGAYSLSNLRFELPPGARFGVRVTLISPEGLPAGSLQVVLVQPEMEPETAEEPAPQMTQMDADQGAGAGEVACVEQSPSAAAETAEENGPQMTRIDADQGAEEVACVGQSPSAASTSRRNYSGPSVPSVP